MGKEKEGFWKALGWREWAVIASAPIVTAGVAAILSPGFRSFIADSATAAWVQAVGSIIAIAVAVYLARSDIRMRQEERKLQEEIYVDVMLGLADEMYAYSTCLVENVHLVRNKATSGYFEFGAPVLDVKVLATMINEAALRASVSKILVREVLSIRQCVQQLEIVMHSALSQYQDFECVPYTDEITDAHDYFGFCLDGLYRAAGRERPHQDS